MRHSAVEKKQIIRLVEGSDLSVRQTLAEAGIHRLTYYGWYRRYLSDGFDGLHDRRPVPRFQWNKIPKTTANRIVEAALADPQLSPRELAWKITDRAKGFVSKSSVYRILKAHDLIASPAFIVMDGCRSIRESDEASERTVADRFYIPACGPLALVVPVNDPGRLLEKGAGLAAFADDVGRRCHRDIGSCPGRNRGLAGARETPPPSALGQWPLLLEQGAGRLSEGCREAAYTRPAITRGLAT